MPPSAHSVAAIFGSAGLSEHIDAATSSFSSVEELLAVAPGVLAGWATESSLSMSDLAKLARAIDQAKALRAADAARPGTPPVPDSMTAATSGVLFGARSPKQPSKNASPSSPASSTSTATLPPQPKMRRMSSATKKRLRRKSLAEAAAAAESAAAAAAATENGGTPPSSPGGPGSSPPSTPERAGSVQKAERSPTRKSEPPSPSSEQKRAEQQQRREELIKLRREDETWSPLDPSLPGAFVPSSRRGRGRSASSKAKTTAAKEKKGAGGSSPRRKRVLKKQNSMSMIHPTYHGVNPGDKAFYHALRGDTRHEKTPEKKKTKTKKKKKKTSSPSPSPSSSPTRVVGAPRNGFGYTGAKAQGGPPPGNLAAPPKKTRTKGKSGDGDGGGDGGGDDDDDLEVFPKAAARKPSSPSKLKQPSPSSFAASQPHASAALARTSVPPRPRPPRARTRRSKEVKAMRQITASADNMIQAQAWGGDSTRLGESLKRSLNLAKVAQENASAAAVATAQDESYTAKRAAKDAAFVQLLQELSVANAALMQLNDYKTKAEERLEKARQVHTTNSAELYSLRIQNTRLKQQVQLANETVLESAEKVARVREQSRLAIAQTKEQSIHAANVKLRKQLQVTQAEGMVTNVNLSRALHDVAIAQSQAREAQEELRAAKAAEETAEAEVGRLSKLLEETQGEVRDTWDMLRMAKEVRKTGVEKELAATSATEAEARQDLKREWHGRQNLVKRAERMAEENLNYSGQHRFRVDDDLARAPM